MKRMLPFVFCLLLMASCKNSTPPKEVAQQFIQAVHKADAATASALATATTKASVSALKAGVPSASTADALFSFSTLSETTSGNTAEVKNDAVKLVLEKESDGWKVAASPETVASIANRESNLAALKIRWEELLREYDSRQQVAQNYVQYKKSQGALSLPIQNMDAVLKTLTAQPANTKEAILEYVRKQHILDDLVDKALEPSFAANVDLSMTYFLQLSNARDRIKKAVDSYRETVAKTPSPVYPQLALRTAR